MKFQLVFLLACWVISTQQRRYYPDEWQGYGGWPAGHYPMSPANRRFVVSDDMVTDFKEYLLARNHLNWRRFEPFGSSNIEVVHQPAQEERSSNFGWDVESRAKGGYQSGQMEVGQAPANPRFFLNIVSTLGSSSAYNNPLLKTIYYFTTATATTCVSTSCIPDSLFDNGKSTIICSRKRSVEYVSNPEEASDELEIRPSFIESVEPTALAPSDRQFTTAVSATTDVLLSSKEQVEDERHFGSELSRKRRFFYNYFYVSTTITTYSFVTTTVTVSLSNLANANELSCRPSTLSLCF